MITKQFLLAGRAVFTIECPESFVVTQKCNPHYTFKVRFKKGSNGYGDTFFVSLLTGPDNEHSYTYLGIIDPASGEFRTTHKSCQKADSIIVLLFRRVVQRLWEGKGEEIERAGFKVHHEGTCGRCGRTLTVPESIESGIGPECARQMGCARVAKSIRSSETSHSRRERKGISFELSERPGFDLSGYEQHRDSEGEVTHWTGSMSGVPVIVFND